MTRKEYDVGHDGMHVPLTCENHREKRWSCKKIATSVDKDGIIRYNGARTLFYNLYSIPTMGPECSCPSEALMFVEGVEDRG